jgi:uncharacterized repeat protein (TIGR03803 family)
MGIHLTQVTTIGSSGFKFIQQFSGSGGPVGGSLAMDAAGNIYGTTFADGANNLGNVFKLTPSNGSWAYTSLHDFAGGEDGSYPYGGVSIDANGNLYGTTSAGGSQGLGVVWEITPSAGPGQISRLSLEGSPQTLADDHELDHFRESLLPGYGSHCVVERGPIPGEWVLTGGCLFELGLTCNPKASDKCPAGEKALPPEPTGCGFPSEVDIARRC